VCGIISGENARGLEVTEDALFTEAGVDAGVIVRG
jgi:hypothetical protein